MLRKIYEGAFVFIVVFILFEIALRLFPVFIPPTMLLYFNESLRGSIASRLDLPVQDDVREIVRDDKGPLLNIYKPHTTIVNQFEDFGSVDVTVDGQGFCNTSDMSYERESIDVITIGDSFTFCTNVASEHTWASNMQENTGRSMYNLGSPGKGLYEYLQILKTFGLSKTPGVVIMAVYEGNDLRDAINYWEFLEHEMEETSNIGDCEARGRVCQVYTAIQDSVVGENSYAFNILLTSVRLSRGALMNKLVDIKGLDDFSYTIEGPEGTIVLNPDNTDFDEVRHAFRLQEGSIKLDVLDDALTTFKQLSEEYNFQPALIYIPSAYTAYTPDVVFAESGLEEVMQSFSNEQRSYYKRTAEKLDIPFFDTTEALQQVAPQYRTSNRLLYFPQNVHLTEYGHSIVAEALLANLILRDGSVR